MPAAGHEALMNTPTSSVAPSPFTHEGAGPLAAARGIRRWVGGYVILTGAIVAAAGLLLWLAQIFHIEPLTVGLSAQLRMAADTALGLALSGTALCCAAWGVQTRPLRWNARGAAGGAALIGLLHLSAYVLGYDPGIDTSALGADS